MRVLRTGSVCCGPGTILSAVHVLAHLIPTTTILLLFLHSCKETKKPRNRQVTCSRSQRYSVAESGSKNSFPGTNTSLTCTLFPLEKCCCLYNVGGVSSSPFNYPSYSVPITSSSRREVIRLLNI